MPVQNPPFSLTVASFRFAALAALAGQAPLGGQREVALATYLAARLAHDVHPRRGLSLPARTARASGARNWLSTHALPAAVRPALLNLIDASIADPPDAAAAVRALATAAASYLDARSRRELELLAAALESAH